MYFVYELVDPRTDITGYIGITNDPNQRYYEHVEGRVGTGKKYEWINRLQEEKIQPKMKILEIVDDRKHAKVQEKYWIQYYLSKGTPLTNIHYKEALPKKDRTSHIIQAKNQKRGYYTQHETQKILGYSASTLKQRVRRGKIRYKVSSETREVLFLKSDVNKLRAEIDAFLGSARKGN